MKQPTNPENVILLGVTTAHETEEETEEHLDELSALAETAGAVELKRFRQKRPHTHPRTFFGSGKLQEVKDYIEGHEVDVAIFDEELTPSQLRNIERILDIKVLDRTNLILDIFATRAQTAQAKTQVELAQSEYLLPRLTKMWTHLSRQKGGIGMKGPGETEIETDRRIVRNNISLLKKKLEQIDKQNVTRRKRRGQKIRVALVGYTNAGKSTVMNLLAKATVLAEDKLFATLDTTVREIVLDQVSFLLSDTVGFIRKLPHGLVESFKSTLDEVREADLLVHVVDISHPKYQHQINTVNDTLKELGAGGKPVLMVFNKIDKLSGEFYGEEEKKKSPAEKLEYLKASWLNESDNEAVFISAVNKTNINEMREKLVSMVKHLYQEIYPFQVKHVHDP
ncbi:MAG: GTPase HflX [Bacteroidia bacterium]